MDVKDIYKLVHVKKIDMPQLCRERSVNYASHFSPLLLFSSLPMLLKKVKPGQPVTYDNDQE